MSSRSTKLGYRELVAIGIGGMVGGGIFAVLGLAVQLAHGGTPVAFAIAGVVALLTTYSYARLSVTFPSQGGTVTFLDKAFGPGAITGTLNVLLWLSYIIMLSLYAYAFGSYGAALLPASWETIGRHLLISLSVLGITVLNLGSTALIGRAEDWIVAIKIGILTLFVLVGAWGVESARIAPAEWSGPVQLFAGGFIIFVAYEGFELIANAADDVDDPQRTLPRAYYTAVVFVIVLYVAVAIVAVGNLSVDQIVNERDFALAAAAKPFLGEAGFTLIAVAAVLSTASAINATLYGAARLSYSIAVDGELPAVLEKKIWNQPILGLLITAGATLVIANLVNLSSISTMGSSGFLLIFAATNLANARLASKTGSRAWLSMVGMAACVLALIALIGQTAREAPGRLIILVGMIALAAAIELSFQLTDHRRARTSS